MKFRGWKDGAEWTCILLIVPLIIRICAIIIEVDLLPNSSFGVFFGHGIIEAMPYFVPFKVTDKFLLPLSYRMVFYIILS